MKNNNCPHVPPHIIDQFIGGKIGVDLSAEIEITHRATSGNGVSIALYRNTITLAEGSIITANVGDIVHYIRSNGDETVIYGGNCAECAADLGITVEDLRLLITPHAYCMNGDAVPAREDRTALCITHVDYYDAYDNPEDGADVYISVVGLIDGRRFGVTFTSLRAGTEQPIIPAPIVGIVEPNDAWGGDREEFEHLAALLEVDRDSLEEHLTFKNIMAAAQAEYNRNIEEDEEG